MALLIGISGPSSSGKSTIASLLHSVVSKSAIVAEDDFYKPDADIPVTNGLQDWDCVAALDVPRLRQTLQDLKSASPTKRASPESLHGSNDATDATDAAGATGASNANVPLEIIAQLQSRFDELLLHLPFVTLVFVEGFVLFTDDMKDVSSLLDWRLFLPTGYAQCKARRQARGRYITADGFWEDPPDYFDAVVWPSYVQQHSHLFVDGDVSGELDTRVCADLGIIGLPRDSLETVESCFRAACEVIIAQLEGIRDRNTGSEP